MAKRAKADQDEEGSGAQVPPTRATGPESATGAALEDRPIPQGEDRGSKVEPEGGWPKPDAEGPENVGAQTEPARFTSNGQIPHNTIPSPTGAVPVGATGLSAEDARARVEEANQAHDDYVAKRGQAAARLSNETISRLHVAELRAIALQRGYALDEFAGTRRARQQFRDAQDQDPVIQERADRVEAARAGSAEAKPRSTSRAKAR